MKAGKGGAREIDTLSPGALLRRYRVAAGLAQDAVAERAGLSVDAVSAIERGLRLLRAGTVRALSTGLGLSAVQTAAPAVGAQPRRRARARTAPAGLTMPASPLIGRAHDVAVVVYLLQTAATRMLTLSGPGGVGKTRMALAEVVHAVPDGVVWVDLAP